MRFAMIIISALASMLAIFSISRRKPRSLQWRTLWTSNDGQEQPINDDI
jgi:hypothetical protein